MKYSYYFSYVFLLGFACLTTDVYGQKLLIKIDDQAKYPSVNTLPLNSRGALIDVAEKTLNQYKEAATLYDAKAKKVTGAAIKNFETLFNPTAKLQKDYEEIIPVDLVTVQEYAAGVFNRLDRQGVQVRLENAILKEIQDDPSGFYVVIVDIEKIIFNYVTSNQQVKQVATGRRLKQQIRFDISKRDLIRARIAKIGLDNSKGSGQSESIADYVRFMGPSIGVVLPSVSPTMSTFWDTNHPNSQFDVSASGFSIGFNFITSGLAGKMSTNKNLFLIAGLNYESQTYTSKINNFIIDGVPAVAESGTQTLNYERIVGMIGDEERPLEAEEKLKIGALKIPVGVGLRLISGERMDFLLSATLVPSLNIASSGSLTGMGHYDGRISEAMWQILETQASNPALIDEDDGLGPFEVGPGQNIAKSSNPNVKGFTLGGQLSPTFFFQLARETPAWTLMLGVDLNVQFGSIFSHEARNGDVEALIYPKSEDNYNTNLLEHYLNDMSVFAPGLRLGLVRRLSRRP